MWPSHCAPKADGSGSSSPFELTLGPSPLIPAPWPLPDSPLCLGAQAGALLTSRVTGRKRTVVSLRVEQKGAPQ